MLTFPASYTHTHSLTRLRRSGRTRFLFKNDSTDLNTTTTPHRPPHRERKTREEGKDLDKHSGGHEIMSPEPGEGGSSRKTTTASIAMRGTLPDFPPPLLRYTLSLKPSPQHRWKSTKPEATTARQAGSGGFHALHTFKHTHTQTFQRWLKTARNSGHECTTFSPHPHSSKKEGRRGRKPLTPRDRKTRPHHAFSSSFRTGCLPPPSSSRLQERNFNLDQGQAHFTPSPSYNVPSSTQ